LTSTSVRTRWRRQAASAKVGITAVPKPASTIEISVPKKLNAVPLRIGAADGGQVLVDHLLDRVARAAARRARPRAMCRPRRGADGGRLIGSVRRGSRTGSDPHQLKAPDRRALQPRRCP
jgi:hypothetical protein